MGNGAATTQTIFPCIVVVLLRSSVFRIGYQLCVKQTESARLSWCLVKAFFSLIIQKWKGIGRNFLSHLASCCEIMWKHFRFSLVTHGWLCLERVLREHMLLILLMLNYLFCAAFPYQQPQSDFGPWLRLYSLRIMPKIMPTNSNPKSFNTTTSVLFCRCSGACSISLGGKIVWLVCQYKLTPIAFEAEKFPRIKSLRKCA